MIKKYAWIKPKEKISSKIKASHDPIKEWHPDPKGYFLIRVNEKQRKIEVGYVTLKHNITKMIYGIDALTIYNTIIKLKLLTRLDHAAYLGKELCKAEIALKLDKKYIQDTPLNFK